MEERLIEIFKEYLPAWSWEEWQAAGSSDKEDIVINALADLGPDMDIEVDEAYDLFYDWCAGLTEADFRSGLEEGNKITNRFADGGMGLARNINMAVTPEERARVAAENEARRQRQAELEAERRAAALERKRQQAIARAEDAIAKGVIDEYNEANRVSILSSLKDNVYPAIDPETQELVFDMAEKKRILDPITQRVEAEKEAKKAAEKEAAKKAAERRAAEKPITYYLYPEVVINGETMRSPNGTRVVGQDNLVRVAKEVAREELAWVNTERKFYVAGGHPFNWDGVITIISENPDGTETPFRSFKVRTNEGLEEAVRIGAGNDALYHYTNLIPFMNILKTDTMKRPDDHEDYAICFTTDEGYRIYEFCFGLQFSRERLAADGYDLMLWDDAEEDNPEYADFYRDHPRAEDARTESEERIYDNIPNVSKYITDIHLHWSPEGKTLDQASDDYDNEDAFIDIAHGKQGDKLIGYEGPNDRIVLVPMSEFKAVLMSLKSRGVQIHTYGTRMRKMYVYDERGKVHKVPAHMRMPKVAEPALV